MSERQAVTIDHRLVWMWSYLNNPAIRGGNQLLDDSLSRLSTLAIGLTCGRTVLSMGPQNDRITTDMLLSGIGNMLETTEHMQRRDSAVVINPPVTGSSILGRYIGAVDAESGDSSAYVCIAQGPADALEVVGYMLDRLVLTPVHEVARHFVKPEELRPWLYET